MAFWGKVKWHGMLAAWMGLGWACIGLAEAEMGCQWHADADASGWWGEVRWHGMLVAGTWRGLHWAG